ncbi:MAG: hypothetical protein EAZ08_14315 [Cytophagales bacterium]|nr:MAG: hypothetical protein EAZ08_14315 [Cytophagales bacterium]
MENLTSQFQKDEGYSEDKITFYVINGHEKLPKMLKKGLDIKYNTRVTAIDYSREKTRVYTGDEYQEADYVVVTLPLGVMKSGNVKFAPRLPSKMRKSMSKLFMSCLNKFVLIWPKSARRFWGDGSQFLIDGKSKYKTKYMSFFD